MHYNIDAGMAPVYFEWWFMSQPLIPMYTGAIPVTVMEEVQ
jgi:hypothetical protein